jgi:2-oxoglutarate dehydrogenase E1 component
VNKADVKTLVSVLVNSIELTAEREKNERRDVAIVRIEQLFPLPVAQLKEIIAKYPNADDYVWAQEEPKNMGVYIA